MKKQILATIILLIITISVFSQSNIGIIVGGGIFDMRFKTTDKELNDLKKDEFNIRFGYHAGFNFENVIIKRQLYLQFGLHARSAGYSSRHDSVGMILHAAHIPIEIKYKYFLDRRGESYIYVSGGPYASANYRGFKYDVSERDRFLDDNSGTSVMTNPKVNFGKKADSDIETFDFGVNLGLGFGYSNFQLGYNFGLGLKNAIPKELLKVEDGYEDIHPTFKHSYHTLTVGYYFSNK